MAMDDATGCIAPVARRTSVTRSSPRCSEMYYGMEAAAADTQKLLKLLKIEKV
jgi:hypothetical protein